MTALLSLLAGGVVNAQSTNSKTLQIVLIRPDSSGPQYYSSDPTHQGSATDFEKGVLFGIEEAQRTGQLLGWTVTLGINQTFGSTPSRQSPLASVMIAQKQSDIPSEVIAQLNNYNGLLLSLFGEHKPISCNGRSFYLTSASSNEAVLWDSTDERFGAAQLNDRYQSRFHEGMDSNAWGGWFAVKVLSEAAFRTGSSKPEKILKYLENSQTKFDGHKGKQFQFGANHVMITDSTSRNAVIGCK